MARAGVPPLTECLAPLSRAIGRVGEELAGARGWRRRFYALAAGLAAALAFAPFYFLPLMAAGMTALVFLLDGAAEERRRRWAAFSVGWFFGFGYFLLGLYWMAFSFFVQADQFAWMAPFAVTGMPAFLALFTGGAAMLAAGFWRPGWPRIFILAAALMAFEYARGHILTGLPWNLPGQALAGAAAGAQSAALYGVYGLSLVTLLIAMAPAAEKGRALMGLAVAVLAAALLFAGGALRLMLPGPGVHEGIVVRVVQPNIPQAEKIDWNLWGRNFARHIELSKGPPPGARLFIVWPENAASSVEEVEGALDSLARDLPRGSVLLTGSARAKREAPGVERYYNSLAVIVDTPAGRRVAGYYDKHHLVPFGEYLPLSGLFRRLGLSQLAPYGDDGFSPGPGARVMTAGGPSFSPLICYEAIFPGALYPRSERPDWLVAVTNDAWFGDTSGPRQHLDQARLRTIETGLPMARSANTGISALIDSRGRYVARIALYEMGVFDAPLPRADPPTLYARIGDWMFAFMWLGVAAIGLFAGRGARTGGPIATFTRSS